MQRQKAPWMWMILLSAIVTITVFSKSSPLYPLNDWVDANCFLTTGKALLSGQVLYRDVYEQKGPFLYFLHALAALVSDSSFFGVWLLEIAACFAYAWIGWRLVLQRCKRPSVLLIPGLLFLTYSTVAFSSGDSAEELALPLIAYAFAAGISIQWKTDLPSNRQALILGITAGLVLWIKYTLCGFYFACALFVAAAAIRQKKWHRLAPLAGFFLLGILAASAPVLLYFIGHHALSDLWTAYFVNNITLYTPSAGGHGRGSGSSGMLQVLLTFALQNPVFSILLVLGILYAAFRNRTELCFLLASLLGCLPFVALGSRPYPYYAFIVAAFTVYGWVPVQEVFSRIACRHALAAAVLSCALSVCMSVAGFHVSLNTYLLGTPKESMPQYQFAEVIRQEEDATLLNYGFLDGGFYTASGLTHESRFFCKLNIDLKEMNRELSDSIQEGKTTFVVTRGKKLQGDTPYELVRQASWPYQSNAESPRSFTYYLYRIRQPET